MRAKEIKIENSFISIFWQWLGSASLRKNKINSKQTQEWATKPNETKHFSVVFVASLCLSLVCCVFENMWVSVCVCIWTELFGRQGMCPTSVKWPQNVPSACWLGLNLLQFPSIPAFYASFAIDFVVLVVFIVVVVVVVVVFAFIWIQINEPRMCWIVLIGAFATIAP